MLYRALFLPLALAGAASLPAQEVRADGAHWLREIKGEVTTGGAGRLKVVTRGRVTVRPAASTRQVVSYTWMQRVSRTAHPEAAARLQALQVRFRTVDGWCVVYAEAPADVISELTVNVPPALRQYVFDLRSGAISVRGLKGEVHAITGAGNVDIDEIDGDVVARTGGGAMNLGRVGGSLRCLSGGGNIRVDRVGAESVMETAGGEIWLNQAGGPVRASTAGNIHIGHAASTVAAHTFGGLIEVGRAGGIVTAESAGGSILIGDAPGVRAESAGGPIKLNRVTGAIRASTASGHVYAILSSARALENSFLATGRGDITVYVPSKLPVTVKALNESAASYGRIISEFPEIRTQLPGSTGAGRPVLAEGAINGGGPTLMLSVSSGTVYLRRLK